MPTLYQTLGIPETATQQEIKSAFRQLSLRHHPDRNNGDKTSEKKFREVLEAYKVLGNPDKKTWYDRQLFYKRQPPPAQPRPPQPAPQSPPPPQPGNRRYGSVREFRRGTDEYIVPDFSRMPWRFMAMVTGGLILFFVLLYNFGPKPKPSMNQVLLEEEARAKWTPVSVVSPQHVKLRDGSDISLSEMAARHAQANTIEILTDIDGDGTEELQLSVTYSQQELFTNKDYIFRRIPPQNGTEDVRYEEFFSHTGGMYIVGNNIRLYFDEIIETYRSCGSCEITGLPNYSLVPAIYLKADKGRFLFAGMNPRRNKEIEENLAYLATIDVPELSAGRDDGTRKEYVRQMVCYYFNNLDYQATEKMFRKYYRGADQDLIWRDIEEIIKTYAQKITSNAAFSNTEAL